VKEWNKNQAEAKAAKNKQYNMKFLMALGPGRTIVFTNCKRSEVPMKIITANGGRKNEPEIIVMVVPQLQQLVCLHHHNHGAKGNKQTAEKKKIKGLFEHFAR
jgi:hypothetical protein